MLHFMLAGCLLILAVIPAIAGKGELEATAKDQQQVSVTIYNQDLALVRDQRRVVIPEGRQVLAFKDVSARIQPETVLFSAKDCRVLEQNFEYDLLTPASLLQKYVGREVAIVRTHPTTGEDQEVPARVLSAAKGQVVLESAGHIETGIPGRLIFPDVPETLRARPTLTMLLESRSGSDREVELSYLTGGLSWQADYVAELADDEASLELNGWVSLNNESGVSYRNARLQLVAGDVHRVRREMRTDLRMKKVMLAAKAEGDMREETMFEYHLYTLERPTTIADRQRKQVALLQASGVRCRKEYVLRGAEYYYSQPFSGSGDKKKVAVYLNLDNTRDDGLGMPLPAGTMRVYKKDLSGSLQFVGEDRIDHTPENETIQLRLGNAFDVTATRKQTDFKKLAGFSAYNYVFESAFTIVLKNARREPVQVRVIEPIPGDWQMITESASHSKETSDTATWIIGVPAKGETSLSYRVQVRY